MPAQSTRNVLAAAKAKVYTHKSGGFESAADEQTFLAEYAEISVGQCLQDCDTAFSGDPRIQEFTAASMTSLQRTATGIDKIATGLNGLFNSYIHNDSTVIHEGLEGYVVFRGGQVFWMPCDGANGLDFLKFQNLFERHIAMMYIDDAPGSSPAEIAAATADYEDYRDVDLLE